VPRIYLEIAQFNPTIQQALRRLQDELPDHLNVDNADEEGTYRAWVSYPDRYGEDKARTAVRQALVKLRVTGIEMAE
jgi:hypothetical protein